MKFNMKNKVWILNSKKLDGKYNKGIIVGIDLAYNPLGYMTERQYFDGFDEYQYKVAYVDVFTNRACSEWVHHSHLSKASPHVRDVK